MDELHISVEKLKELYSLNPDPEISEILYDIINSSRSAWEAVVLGVGLGIFLVKNKRY